MKHYPFISLHKSLLAWAAMVVFVLPISAHAQYSATIPTGAIPVNPYATKPAASGSPATNNPYQNSGVAGKVAPYGTQPQMSNMGVASKTPVLRNESELSASERRELNQKNKSAVEYHELKKQQYLQEVKRITRESLKDTPEMIPDYLAKAEQQFGSGNVPMKTQINQQPSADITQPSLGNIAAQVPPSTNALPSTDAPKTQEARRIFELNWKAAHDGNADGQFNVGKMMLIGQGVKKDPQRALFWMEKAGRQGHKAAIQELATIYFSSLQYVNAKYWLERLEEKGDVGAMEKLSQIYAEGLGIPKNDKKAVEYLLKAANRNSAAAQLLLFFRCAGGMGVEKDLAEAVKWGVLVSRKDANARAGFENFKKSLTPAQILEGEKRASQWAPVS